MAQPTTVTGAATLTPKEKASAERTADSITGALSSSASAISKTATDGYAATGNFFSGVYNSFKEKGFVGGMSDMFSSLWNMVSGLFGENGLNVGSLTGSGIGGFLGWSLGSFVGGGYFGTLISVAATACGLVIGAQVGDKTINPILGRSSRGTSPLPVTDQSPTPQFSINNPQTAIGANVPLSTTPIDFSVIDQHLAQVRERYANAQVTGTQTAQVAYAPQGAAPSVAPGQRLGWGIGSGGN